MIMDTLIFVFLFGQVFAFSIIINGPAYVRKGEHVWINCSSDVVPSGHYTEFIVNGETLDSLERQTTGCFSAIKRAKCSSNLCHCSQDAKTYAMRINVVQQFQDLTVECSMQFKSKDVKKAITIRVLDLTMPQIEIDGDDVLVAGIKRLLRCNVITPLALQMFWKCFNITADPPNRYNSSLYISGYLEAKSSDHGDNCTCIVQYENYVTSASITLNISSPPYIQISNNFICNQTADTQLLCTLSGDLNDFGFEQWVHTVNGNLIRRMNGKTRGNMSTLLIQSCSYEDVGNFTCIAWNKNNNKEYRSNKTTTLSINNVPVITDTETNTDPGLQFVVLYYSVPTPVDIQWFRYGEKLENSTSYSFSSTKQPINLQIHGINILYEGYRSSLSVAKPLAGEYTVVLKNTIGETKHYFEWQSGKNAFDFQTLLWGLTGVVIFIATTGLMGICMTIKTIQGNKHDTVILRTKPAAIYYAAPGEDNYVHVYNDTQHVYNQSMNSSAGQYEEIPDNYEDINRRVDVRHYDVTHHYIEIDL